MSQVCVCVGHPRDSIEIKSNFNRDNTVQGGGEPVREDIGKETYLVVVIEFGQVITKSTAK